MVFFVLVGLVFAAIAVLLAFSDGVAVRMMAKTAVKLVVTFIVGMLAVGGGEWAFAAMPGRYLAQAAAGFGEPRTVQSQGDSFDLEEFSTAFYGVVPTFCSAAHGGSGKGWTVWDRARKPQLVRYCELLGFALGASVRRPNEAMQAAMLADRTMPGTAVPWVVVAHGAVSAGNYEKAIQAFEKAKSIDPRSVDSAQSQALLGVSLQRTGNLEGALRAYQWAILRLGELPGTNERVFVLLAASSIRMYQLDHPSAVSAISSIVSSAVPDAANQATMQHRELNGAGLQQALGYLTQARGQPLSRYSAHVMAMHALALEQAGHSEGAKMVVDEIVRGELDDELVSAQAQRVNFLCDISPSDTGPSALAQTRSQQWKRVCELIQAGKERKGAGKREGNQSKKTR